MTPNIPFMYNPISTYRLQFHKEFTLADLDALLPYLPALGVTTIYASPIFEATPESLHGYDGVDPNRINPEIGTHEQLQTLSQRLQKVGIGWLQDIVPNHMAYHPNNKWLMDVLEKGPLSRYALFFETSLASSFFQGRILAPFLPESLDETIAKQELTLTYEQERFVLKVSGNVLPLKVGSYATVLQAGATEPNEALQQLLTELDQLRHLNEPEAYALEWDEFRQQLSALMTNSLVGDYVQQCIAHINNNPARLVQLAEEQHYHFCTEPEHGR